MIPMSENAAIQHSVEIAKILCETRSQNYPINADTANRIADFIETLQKRFREGSAKPD